MNSKPSGKNESLEMLRAVNELTRGFKETAPLFLEVIGLMRQAVSGENAFGYFEAASKIDNASTDEKDIMLLLGTQFLASILYAATTNEALKTALKEQFPDSNLFLGL